MYLSGEYAPLYDAVADAKATQLMHSFGYGRRLPSEAASLVKSVRSLSIEAACATPTKTAEVKKLCANAQALCVDDHSGWLPPSKARAKISVRTGTTRRHNARRLTQSPQWGDLAGSFSAIYREVEPSGVSYTAFLRRFLCTDGNL